MHPFIKALEDELKNIKDSPRETLSHSKFKFRFHNPVKFFIKLSKRLHNGEGGQHWNFVKPLKDKELVEVIYYPITGMRYSVRFELESARKFANDILWAVNHIELKE